MTRRLGIILGICLFGVAAASTSPASDARDAALQTRGWMTADDATIWRLPTDLADHPDRVFGELTSEIGGHDYAGGHLKTGPATLRVFVGDYPRGDGGALLLQQTRTPSFETGNVPPNDVANAGLAQGGLPDGRAHALVAIPIGRKARAAVGVDYSASTWLDVMAPAPAEGSTAAGSSRLDRASLLSGHVGISLPLAPFENLALGVRYDRPSFEGTREQTNAGPTPYIQRAAYEDDGGHAIGVTALGTWRDLLGRDTEGRLYLNFESGALDGISRQNTATDPDLRIDSRKELRTTRFAAGWANNHHIASRVLAIWGTEFDWVRHEINVDDEPFSGSDTVIRTESDETSISWPATLALEGWLRSWWAARVSASSSLWSRTETTARQQDRRQPGRSIPENHRLSAGSHQDVAIGTALRFGGLTLDGVVNRSLLYDGPYFLGGASTGIWTRLSLRYEF